jgi:hypothetical protein
MVAYGPSVGSMLASNADRDRAVDVLRAGFAEGRLTQSEFADRVARVQAARTYDQLAALTCDLPAGPWATTVVPYQNQPPLPTEAPIFNLALTALVVFTLTALVTALMLWAHAHAIASFNGQQGTGQPGVIHVLPYMKSAPGQKNHG